MPPPARALKGQQPEVSAAPDDEHGPLWTRPPWARSDPSAGHGCRLKCDEPMVVTAGVRHQRVVRALLQDSTVLDRHDLVRVGNGGQSELQHVGRLAAPPPEPAVLRYRGCRVIPRASTRGPPQSPLEHPARSKGLTLPQPFHLTTELAGKRPYGPTRPSLPLWSGHSSHNVSSNATSRGPWTMPPNCGFQPMPNRAKVRSPRREPTHHARISVEFNETCRSIPRTHSQTDAQLHAAAHRHPSPNAPDTAQPPRPVPPARPGYARHAGRRPVVFSPSPSPPPIGTQGRFRRRRPEPAHRQQKTRETTPHEDIRRRQTQETQAQPRPPFPYQGPEGHRRTRHTHRSTRSRRSCAKPSHNLVRRSRQPPQRARRLQPNNQIQLTSPFGQPFTRTTSCPSNKATRSSRRSTSHRLTSRTSHRARLRRGRVNPG